jgi:hypothetical protein
MRNTIIIFIISLIAVSCGKDKYTSAPQIKFKSVSPNRVLSNVPPNDPNMPLITINVTDSEGDFGDTTVFIKRIINGVPHYKLDSFKIPDISSIKTKNFQADIRINSFDILRGDSTRPQRHKQDTLTFEIYVKDLAKNKSNVIITPDPIYYITP